MQSVPNEPPAMELPTPNLPLLRKVLDHIDAHPEEWNQCNFGPTVGGCRTTYCVAGHAVAMTVGLRPVSGAEFGAYAVEPADGSSWEEAGRRELGLTTIEAKELFYGTVTPHIYEVGTTRQAVQVVAEWIAARAGEVL